MEYREEDYLQLSGLQHFAFCKRQWALIHIENQWEENYRTVDGEILHQNVHNPYFSEKRGDLITKHAVRVFSSKMGISGECDVLEFHKSENGINLFGYDGFWMPYPVEYKRGKPGTTDGNVLQLCAQAMCLEEMLCCNISQGALYYGEIRHRETVVFSDELKKQVIQFINEMHDYYSKGYTPKAKLKKSCNSCSLKEICLPKLLKKCTVSDYIEEMMKEI